YPAAQLCTCQAPPAPAWCGAPALPRTGGAATCSYRKARHIISFYISRICSMLCQAQYALPGSFFHAVFIQLHLQGNSLLCLLLSSSKNPLMASFIFPCTQQMAHLSSEAKPIRPLPRPKTALSRFARMQARTAATFLKNPPTAKPISV